MKIICGGEKGKTMVVCTMLCNCHRTVSLFVPYLTLSSIYTHFTFFHNVFYAICISKSLIATFQLSSAASLNLGRSQNGVVGNGLTFDLRIISFNTLTESLWAKEKMFVPSVSSFSHNFFYPINNIIIFSACLQKINAFKLNT